MNKIGNAFGKIIAAIALIIGAFVLSIIIIPLVPLAMIWIGYHGALVLVICLTIAIASSLWNVIAKRKEK